jgi:hypothetical protein
MKLLADASGMTIDRKYLELTVQVDTNVFVRLKNDTKTFSSLRLPTAARAKRGWFRTLVL